ncbi:MAG: dTMP kinase [Saprospiraceae bacterium]
MKKSLFIVIEGLDGSGKTSAGRRLRNILDESYTNRIKSTYEPHDPSCGGIYIRQVLMKKITEFHPRVLALAFAANRLDHCEREIIPLLNADEPHIVISDRYYLSSLVYQSAADFPFDKVMEINEKAIKPDIIFFLNVSNEVCYERMNIRNQPKELFETNLGETREKYQNAVDFLRKQNNDNIIEVDGSGTIDEVAHIMLNHIVEQFPDWKFEPKAIDIHNHFHLSANVETVLETIGNEISTIENSTDKKAIVSEHLEHLDNETLGNLFLKSLENDGIEVGKPVPATTFSTYELTYTLPQNLKIRGAAIIFPEQQQYDALLKLVSELEESMDFLYVFSPESKAIVTDYFERDKMQFKIGKIGLFPSTKILTKDDLVAFVLTQVH